MHRQSVRISLFPRHGFLRLLDRLSVQNGQVTVNIPGRSAVAMHSGARLGSVPQNTSTGSKQNTNPTTGTIATIFKLTADTTWGETIYVVGSIPALGNWDANKAIPLTTKQGTYPSWSSAPVTLPLNTSFKYKFIRKHNGKVSRCQRTQLSY